MISLQIICSKKIRLQRCARVTDLTTQYIIKHYQTLWLSLNKSASVNYRTVQTFEGIFFKKHHLRCLDLKGKMESIKRNVTKELRMPWQVRLHLHTFCSLSMSVKILKNLLFLCNPLSREFTCCTQRICIGSAPKIREKRFFHETDEAVTKGRRQKIDHWSRRKIQGLPFIFLYPGYFFLFIYLPIPSPF